MGSSTSFAGDLIENLNSLGSANSDGYNSCWSAYYAEQRASQKTSGGFPRLDFVSFAYHHALAPITTKRALDVEIAIHKVSGW